MYTVKIKKNGGFFWNHIKNISNDWILIDFLPLFPKRTLMDKDKNTYDINLNDFIVVFSRNIETPKDFKKSRIPFDVKYKLNDGILWKSIKNCVVDTVVYEKTDSPIRVFITDEGERWEIPFKHYIFKFDKNKMLAIQDTMEQEVGQPIGAIK